MLLLVSFFKSVPSEVFVGWTFKSRLRRMSEDIVTVMRIDVVCWFCLCDDDVFRYTVCCYMRGIGTPFSTKSGILTMTNESKGGNTSLSGVTGNPWREATRLFRVVGS